MPRCGIQGAETAVPPQQQSSSMPPSRQHRSMPKWQRLAPCRVAGLKHTQRSGFRRCHEHPCFSSLLVSLMNHRNTKLPNLQRFKRTSMTFRSATKLLLRAFLGCSSWSPNSFRSLTFSRNQCCQKGVLPGSYGGLTTSSYVVFGLVLMVLVVFPLKLAHIFARCTTHYYSEAESHAQQ